MKSLLNLIAVLFCTLFTLDGYAQIYWVGNAPGHENDWNYHQNWSKYRVPSEFDDVIIPDVSVKGNQYPIIDQEVKVNSLYITSNAQVTIQSDGKLIVVGQDAYNHGVMNLGCLKNEGTLQVQNEGLSPLFRNNKDNYEGTGMIKIKDEQFTAVFALNDWNE